MEHASSVCFNCRCLGHVKKYCQSKMQPRVDTPNPEDIRQIVRQEVQGAFSMLPAMLMVFPTLMALQAEILKLRAENAMFRRCFAELVLPAIRAAPRDEKQPGSVVALPVSNADALKTQTA